MLNQGCKLFHYLKKFKLSAENADTIEYKIGEIFSELKNRLQSGYNLREVINLIDELKRTEDSFKYDGGINEYIREITKKKSLIHDEIIYVSDSKKDTTIELALLWTSSYQEDILCFTNNIPQKDGGTHLAGFRASLTKTINSILNQ